MKQLIILDRDGVINHDSDEYIKSPDEWLPIPGSLEAIADLYRAGFHIVVTTNQSGVARGLYTEATLQAIHDKMQNALREHGAHIDHIFYCPHGPWEHCHCRKPEPGLFESVQQVLQRPLTNVPAVGDSLRDHQAACKLGCRPYHVRTGKGELTITNNTVKLAALDTTIVDDLRAVADQLLKTK